MYPHSQPRWVTLLIRQCRRDRGLPPNLHQMNPAPTSSESFTQWFDRQGFRNFTASELTWYFSKVRKGVKNSFPPRELWTNIIPTIRILDDLRDFFGRPVEITSSFRELFYNRAINSPDGSQHIRFTAIDFTVPGVPTTRVFQILLRWRDKENRFTGGLGKYPTFIHLDTRPYDATW